MASCLVLLALSVWGSQVPQDRDSTLLSRSQVDNEPLQSNTDPRPKDAWNWNSMKLHHRSSLATAKRDSSETEGISSEVGVNSSSNHYLTGVNALWMAGVMGVVLCYKYLFHKNKIVYFPESVASVFVGIFVGGILLIASSGSIPNFKPEMFFYVFLPPIIFKAGFGVERTMFFPNIGSIIVFAFFGTIISTLVIGFSLFGLAKANIVPLNAHNAVESLMFGALISSTDPVSTVSIMSSLDTNPMLHALIFGESVLNDAVCITLYKTLEGFHPFLSEKPSMESFDIKEFGHVMIIFCGITLVSILIGVVFGVLCSMLSKRSPRIKHHPEIEMGMTFIFAYGCYCVGEILEMSGITALFFCGIVMSRYHSHNLSESSRIAVSSSVQAFGFFAETAVFIVLGITAVTSFSAASKYQWSPEFVGMGLILCVVSRCFQVSLLSFLLNFGLREKITTKMQIVMILAGLRGAVSFALSLQVPTHSSNHIATTTLAIVIATTVVQGGLTGWLIQRLDLNHGTAKKLEDCEISKKNTIFCGACEEDCVSRVLGGAKEPKTPRYEGTAGFRASPIVSSQPVANLDAKNNENGLAPRTAPAQRLVHSDNYSANAVEAVRA